MDESGIPLNMRDIVASNGIIHTLDGIFIPPSIIPILPHRCNEEQHKIVMVSQLHTAGACCAPHTHLEAKSRLCKLHLGNVVSLRVPLV